MHSTVEIALSGWYGHAAPFAFDIGYRPAENIERMRIGTQSIAAFSLLSAALDIWDQVDLEDLRARSIELSELFINEVAKRCPELTLASPLNPAERGSHVSFQFEHGYPCMQALIAANVIGDFRAPDIMRFGITPLFIDHSDILNAVITMEDIIKNKIWQEEKYQIRALVT